MINRHLLQQLQQSIGQRRLAGYDSNEAQYMALMNAGVEQAQAFQYSVGVALSDAQMARLTSDIVWPVRQSVTLADGSTQEVLAPQVYLRANRMRITGEGALIAGNDIDLQTRQDLVNDGGVIAARQSVSLAADNIQNLGGRLSGADTLLQAQTDIDNLGGVIDGSNRAIADFNASLRQRLVNDWTENYVRPPGRRNFRESPVPASPSSMRSRLQQAP